MSYRTLTSGPPAKEPFALNIVLVPRGVGCRLALGSGWKVVRVFARGAVLEGTALKHMTNLWLPISTDLLAAAVASSAAAASVLA